MMKKPIMSAVALASVLAMETAVAATTEFLPIGDKDGISIAKYPVTNAEYAHFEKRDINDFTTYK